MSVPIQLTSMVSPLMVASMYEFGSLELVCFHVPVRSSSWGLGSSLLVSVFDVPSDLAGASEAALLPPQAVSPASNSVAAINATDFFMVLFFFLLEGHTVVQPVFVCLDYPRHYVELTRYRAFIVAV